jgi:hypothetical protein
MNEFAKNTEKGIVMDVGKSENWVEESLVIAFDFYYAIVTAFNAHFNLGLEKRLSELEDRYVTELGALNNN